MAASIPYTAEPTRKSSTISQSSSLLSSCPTPASFSPVTSPDESLAVADNKNLGTPADRFARWRPSYHLQARTGWMNDPCAPCYDAATGLYHVYFQWNPHSADWDNICWGRATSKDMVDWTLTDDPVLSTGMPYDCKGVFTGCMINDSEGALTCFYTSVSSLPIHYTLPHPRGCESLSMASSRDGGVTWQKSEQNPILPGEPEGVQVGAWRDPFVAAWQRASQLLGRDAAVTRFGLIAGGIPDVTPTAFLYAIDQEDISKWDYIGPLFYERQNIRLSRWSGDLGKNWEVVNFVTLHDEQDPSVQRDFLTMGTEGCLEFGAEDSASSRAIQDGPSRTPRQQLWISGDLIPTNTDDSDKPGVRFDYRFGGHLDHGCVYAANSFHDPVSGKNLVWGWITEEDLCDELRTAQGWSGLLSLPRELSLQTTHHVVKGCASSVASITSFENTPDQHGSFTMRTLGSRPASSVVDTLRKPATIRHARPGSLAERDAVTSLAFASSQVSNSRWNLECSIKVSKYCSTVGIVLLHSADASQATVLSFDPRAEEFVITRPSLNSSASSNLINTAPEKAPHTLLITRDPATGREDLETLHIDAWRDKSVLEVFVNGRTAVTTRLYAAELTFGIQFFASHDERVPGSESSQLVSATLWDGVGHDV